MLCFNHVKTTKGENDMNLEDAKRAARDEIRRDNDIDELVIVKDNMADDPAEPYGYCARMMIGYLYMSCDIVGTIHRNDVS